MDIHVDAMDGAKDGEIFGLRLGYNVGFNGCGWYTT